MTKALCLNAITIIMIIIIIVIIIKIIIIITIIYSIYRALIPSGPKALYIIKITTKS